MLSHPLIPTIVRNLLLLLLAGHFGNYRWAANMKRKACRKIGTALNINFNITSLRINGFGKFIATGLQWESENKVQISISSIQISIRLQPLIKKQLQLSYLYVEKINCTIRRTANQNNTEKKSKKAAVRLPQQSHYRLLHAAMRQLFQYLPAHSIIHKTIIKQTDNNTGQVLLTLQDFQLQQQSFTAIIHSIYTGTAPVSVNGQISSKQRTVQINRLKNTDDAAVFSLQLPHKNISFTGHSGSIELSMQDHASFSIHFSSHYNYIHWNRFASYPVSIAELSGTLACRLSDSAFTITDKSFIQYNGLTLQIFAKHDFPHQFVNTNLYLKNITAAAFLESFPHFYYKPLYDIRFGQEDLTIMMQGGFRTNNPWDHFFELSLQPGQPALLEIPATWPNLEQYFIHDIYEKEQLIHRVDLQAANKYFLPADKVPKIMLDTILECEDAGFFKHHGIDVKGLGYSIIQNMINREFSRGASTITMQLVRNLFLHHHKTIYRKIEETFIALLLENIFQLPKKRILELYLNIIEFGPGIYGVNAACDYYFSKSPHEMTITDCLVLTYIIPRPKFFLDAYMNSSEKLKRNLKKHMELFSRLLFLQGILSQEDVDAIGTTICIRDKTLSLV